MVFLSMFRDNLKEVIEYNGIVIKELAAKTGISKRTIDTYVDSRGVIPNAEIAVKLAKALGTTVEYLVTGTNSLNQMNVNDFNLLNKHRETIYKFDSLTPDMQKAILNLIITASKD